MLYHYPRRCRTCGVAEATPGSSIQKRLRYCFKCWANLRSDLQILVDTLGALVILFVIGMLVGWALVPKKPTAILKSNVEAVREVNR